MHIRTVIPILIAAAAFAAERPLYLDPAQPVEKRVEDLLKRMTLEEKVGQMNMPCVYERGLGKDIATKLQGCRAFAEGTWVKGLGPGGGFFTLANTILHEGPRKQAEYFNELQRIALEKTRLKIPLLQTEEGTHGLMCSGGTVFPEGLALGSTWNLELLNRVYSAAAREARAVGIHQLFTLVVEPYRDPRLGRSQEGFSEDPWYVGRIAETIVGAVQGTGVNAPDKVVAGLCHYPGQSEPFGGMERGAMHVSERKLREYFLPPWVAGIKRMGALGVMATYPAIDGIPAHGSDWILTKILRDELNFQGLVLGEGGGIGTLVYEGLAADQKEAGQLALRSGLDVGISYEEGYMVPLIESVREGKAPVELIDRAVRRILTQKFRLGLFEKPYVDPDQAERGIDRAAHRRIALDAARQAIVLLKNDKGLLPFRKDVKSVAVIGPNADHARNQLGDYTSRTVLQDVVTVLEGIREKLPAAKVTYVQGCDVIGDKVNQIAEAQRAAKAAELAVIVVGENEWQGPQGTSGEGYDVASLDLTGIQEELIKAVHTTGTPAVVVLINGRPLSIRWTAEHVPAILEAWFPGEMGGAAVADIIFGDRNPSGRLPVTVPRHVGQLPMYYNHDRGKEHWVAHSWAKGSPYIGMPATPLFAFGHGLTYTTFDYGGLEVSPAAVNTDGTVEVALSLTNTGKRPGEELVQLYVRDAVATVGRPVKELKSFAKVALAPGERKRVVLKLPVQELAFLDRSLRRVVEPGRFEVLVGASAENIRLRGAFEVTPSAADAPRYAGKTRYLDNARAVVVHSFDDSVPQVVNTLDALDKYGVKATAFIDTDRKSAADLWPRLNEAIANGHEVGSHSRKHQCAWPATEEVCRKFYTAEEITGSRDEILRNTKQPAVLAWGYPCGLCSGFDFVQKLLSDAGYIVARNYPGETENKHNVPDVQDWALNPLDLAYTQVVQKKGGIAKSGRTDVPEINAKFDEVYAKGGIYHFMTHPAWLDFGPDAFYEQHLKHIGGRRDVWYVPLGPLYAYRKVREATEVREAGPGRFEVRHSLDPKVYATVVTLEFELKGAAPREARSNGKLIPQRPPMPTGRWDREYYRIEGGRLFVTVRPNTTLEMR